MSKKRLVIILSISFVLIMVSVFFIVLNQLNKPENIIRQFETAIEKNDSQLLESIIIPDTSEVVVNEQSATALLNYLKSNHHSYQVIKEGLRKQIEKKDYARTNHQVSLMMDGKKWGMFKNYKLYVKTVSIQVSGHYEEDSVHLTIDESELPLSEEGYYGPILPGLYPITVTVENDIGMFTETKEIDVWGNDVITNVVDTKNLVKKDEKVNNEIMEAVNTFNYDFSVFETNEFNLESFTNLDKTSFDMEYTQQLITTSYTGMVDYIEEIHSKYKGATVHLNDFSVNYFDGVWTAEMTGFVSYERKVKYKDVNDFEDFSIDAIRNYTLTFDQSRKKWLITDFIDRKSRGEENKNWKETLMLEGDSNGLKWVRPENINPITNL